MPEHDGSIIIDTKIKHKDEIEAIKKILSEVSKEKVDVSIIDYNKEKAKLEKLSRELKILNLQIEDFRKNKDYAFKKYPSAAYSINDYIASIGDSLYKQQEKHKKDLQILKTKISHMNPDQQLKLERESAKLAAEKEKLDRAKLDIESARANQQVKLERESVKLAADKEKLDRAKLDIESARANQQLKLERESVKLAAEKEKLDRAKLDIESARANQQVKLERESVKLAAEKEKLNERSLKLNIANTKSHRALNKELKSSMFPTLDNLAKKITRISNMAKLMLTRSIIRGAFKGFDEGLQNLAKNNSLFDASISGIINSCTNLKNALISSISPAIQAVSPIIVSLADKITNALNTIAAFNARIFNNANVFYKAKKSQVSYAKSLDKTNKSANKLKDTLAKFDDLDILSDRAGTSSNELASSNSPVFEPIKISNNVMNFADRIKAQLSTLYPELDRLKKYNLDNLKNFYTYTLVPIGKWTLNDGLPRFCNILKRTLEDINYEKVNDGLKGLYTRIGSFTIKTGDGLLWLIDNVLRPLSKPLINDLLPSTLGLFNTSVDVLSSLINANKSEFNWFLNDFIVPLGEKTFTGLANRIESSNNKLRDFGRWIDNNQESVSGFSSSIFNIAGGYFAITKGSEALIKLGNKLKGFFTGATAAAAGFNIELAGIVALFDFIAKLIGKIKNLPSVFSGLQGLSGKMFNLKGQEVTIGDMKNAQSFLNASKSPISAFKWLYSSSNRDNTTVSSRLEEAKRQRLELQKKLKGRIKGFAYGNVIPPNNKYLAYLGDNPTEYEVVSPLSTMKNAFLEAISESGSNSSKIINLNIDGQVFARVVVPYINKENTRVGTKLITGGTG